MAVAFFSVLFFVVFQSSTCANLKAPPSLLESAHGKFNCNFSADVCVCVCVIVVLENRKLSKSVSPL